MKYTLVCLAHRMNTDVFAITMASFRTHVRPLPEKVILIHDGPLTKNAAVDYAAIQPGIVIYDSDRTEGFCDATSRAWEAGASSSEDFVMHLEHDFMFKRMVFLDHLADVLVVYPELAQMSLMRQPVNVDELREGSVVQSFPEGTFQLGDYIEGNDVSLGGAKHQHFLTHRAYFTTNPSLMLRDFMIDNPWPQYARMCEGRFTHDLIARGFSFGVWGAGEPWVEHIGERNGFGY